MVEREFPGRDEVRAQLASVTARTIDDDGSLELRTSSATNAGVERRVPAEAWYVDDDGIVVNLLLHVLQGKVRELEIYKDDSSPIRKVPAAETLDFTPRYDEKGRARA